MNKNKHLLTKQKKILTMDSQQFKYITIKTNDLKIVLIVSANACMC